MGDLTPLSPKAVEIEDSSPSFQASDCSGQPQSHTLSRADPAHPWFRPPHPLSSSP